MSAAVREHRVNAFCDWLESVPPSPPFHTRPEFKFFADLTDAEMDAVGDEMERRAAAHHAEAEQLRAIQQQRLTQRGLL